MADPLQVRLKERAVIELFFDEETPATIYQRLLRVYKDEMLVLSYVSTKLVTITISLVMSFSKNVKSVALSLVQQ